MKKMYFLALGLSLGAVTIAQPVPAYAQAETKALISLNVNDASVRKVIESMFQQAGINNYVIDNNVTGFVTLKITDQPFENAFKLVMRASSTPLTYTKENDVWIVKPRTVSQTTQDLNAAPPVDPTLDPGARPAAAYERINLTYLDPMDLQMVTGGIIPISFFTRFGNSGGGMGGMGGGMGGMGMGGMGMGGMGMGMGGMGGGMGGMMGGMGGMGMGGMGMGGMGGGMGGMMGGMGGMMGGMGGMGGGMMGGMGGFGGFGR